MKKFAVLLFVQLFFATGVFAQAQIGSFYGLKLGMTISEVRSALSSQGKTMESKDSYYRVDSPKLGDSAFEALHIKFSDLKLVEAKFVNYLGMSNAPWEPNSDIIESTVASRASIYKSIYNQMRLNFISKYGNPQIDGDEGTIWRTGMNQLSLLFKHDKEPWPGSDAYTLFTEVSVIYKSLSANVNY